MTWPMRSLERPLPSLRVGSEGPVNGARPSVREEDLTGAASSSFTR
jgi:hypothetical protein